MITKIFSSLRSHGASFHSFDRGPPKLRGGPGVGGGNCPGGAVDQILVEDVPSRFQKHTRSLYQFLKKIYRTLYQFFEKVCPTLYFIPKSFKIGTVPYTKIVKIDTALYTNIWKIDTFPDGTSPDPKYIVHPPGVIEWRWKFDTTVWPDRRNLHRKNKTGKIESKSFEKISVRGCSFTLAAIFAMLEINFPREKILLF